MGIRNFLALLLVIALGVVAMTVLDNKEQGTTTERGFALVNLQENKITEIAFSGLTNAQPTKTSEPHQLGDLNTFAIRRGVGGVTWLLNAPEGALADPKKVNLLLLVVTQLKAKSSFSVPGTDLTQYGLNPPALSLTIKSDNEVEHIRFGNVQPFGKQRYAQIVSNSSTSEHLQTPVTVGLISEDIFSQLLRVIRLLGVIQPLAFQQNQVVSAEIKLTQDENQIGPVKLIRASQGSAWQLEVNNEIYLGDRSEIEAFLGKLSAITAEEIIPSPEPLTNYGLDRPLATVLLKLKPQDADSETEVVELSFGVTDSSAPLYFAKRGDDPLVLRFNARSGNGRVVHDLRRLSTLLRSKFLLGWIPDQEIQSVTLERLSLKDTANRQEVSLTKGVEGWRIKSGTAKDKAMLSNEASTLIRDAISWQVLSVEGESQGGRALNPSLKLRIEFSEEKKQKVLVDFFGDLTNSTKDSEPFTALFILPRGRSIRALVSSQTVDDLVALFWPKPADSANKFKPEDR